MTIIIVIPPPQLRNNNIKWLYKLKLLTYIHNIGTWSENYAGIISSSLAYGYESNVKKNGFRTKCKYRQSLMLTVLVTLQL